MNPFVYIVPPIVLALLIYQLVMRKRGLASTQHATLAVLAQRLGLTILQGDPKLNLYYLTSPNKNYKRTIHMQGHPYGHQASFGFTDGFKTSDYLVMVKHTTTWGCQLIVRPNVQIPDFEIVHRRPARYLEPKRVHDRFPEVGLGQPQLDSKYKVTTLDPRVTAAIAHVAHLFEGKTYFHIAAHGGAVMIPLTRLGMPYFVHAAEDMLYMLEALVHALEGTSIPAQRPLISAGQAAANPGAQVQQY